MPGAATKSSQKQMHSADTVKNEALPARERRSIGENSLPEIIIQRKLTVGIPDDSYEREADVVADNVVRMPQQSFVQRKCAGCQEEQEKIQRKPLSSMITSFIQRDGGINTTVTNDVADSITTSPGSGSRLDGGTESFMSHHFGHDFSDVKIHTDAEAIKLNRHLDAKAFTVGNDMYFNEGQYRPSSYTGKQLLAHELTHVVQQGGNKGPGMIQRRTARNRYSTAADERGPVWQVTLTITGAPETDTESFQEFQNACMDGVRGAARALGNGSGATSRRIAVTVRFQRRFDYSSVEQQAYRSALQSVLPAPAPSAVPAPAPGPSATATPETPATPPTPTTPPPPAVAPGTPQTCSPAGPQRAAEGCTANPLGANLPPVGGTHTESHPFEPCRLTQAEVASRSDWCVDAQQAHGGEVCYRQIPATRGAPGDQYCYSENCCHNSADAVSVVDPGSPGSNSCCGSSYRSYPGHIWNDVVPEFRDDPGRVIRDIFHL